MEECSLCIISRPTSRIRVAHLRGRKAIMMVQVVNNIIGRNHHGTQPPRDINFSEDRLLWAAAAALQSKPEPHHQFGGAPPSMQHVSSFVAWYCGA